MRRNNMHRLHRSAGFSLVEALVALVVLSIGMLGIAALYVESLRSGRTAVLRTQAVMLAGDMADRIRANRSGRDAYEGAVTAVDTNNNNCKAGGTGTGCAADELARHDKAVWLGALNVALPGGTGTIDFDAGSNPPTYTITVTWTEQGQNDTSTGTADVGTYQLRIQA
jgi:type IV pilus assembly protein PilV